MIGQKNRFHGYGSLKGVYQRGKTVRGPLLSLKFADRPADKPYRLAVVVSKKVHKSAVVRNRIRRRIYELCRLNAGMLEGKDVVFTVFGDQIATLDAPKLEKSVQSMLQKMSE